MRARAAVLHRADAPLAVEDVELEEPRPGEVLVALHTSGICHSDLSFANGTWPLPLPAVLGHEAYGEIVAVGPGVASDRVGERVVLTFTPACGRCRFCLQGRVNLCVEAARNMDSGHMPDGTTRLSLDGAPLHHLALVSSFATHAVTLAEAAIPVPAELDPAIGCLLGCGVMTGILSVTHRAGVRPGESVAVFGCGGVGLSAVAGARLVSAWPIVAVDPIPAKRELARTLGATHVVDPTADDPAEAVLALSDGGAEHVFEAVGRPDVIRQAMSATATGGTTVLIGQPAAGVDAPLPVYEVTQFEHAVLGTHIGGATPALHIPRLARLVVAGRLHLEPLVTHRFPLDDIDAALAAAAGGEAGRVVLELC